MPVPTIPAKAAAAAAPPPYLCLGPANADEGSTALSASAATVAMTADRPASENALLRVNICGYLHGDRRQIFGVNPPLPCWVPQGKHKPRTACWHMSLDAHGRFRIASPE